ncbi:hypothetical protein [Telluribacter sp. SYSU D00476]|uniref:hypothetical protein n=1 Tax=Telluribacter sp. SYSU D00476 TaxID=2811430 RepID=UPI001FF2D0B3|nr:hypothetical protein [Telluribacter sp. SYSU D00476]
MAKQTPKTSKSKEVTALSIPEIPIKITVEIIVRQESIVQPRLNRFHSLDAAGGAGCPDNKFSYSFDTQNASVLSLIVEEFEKDNPDGSGEFTTCINDPSPEPKVRIIGLAKEDNAGGRVALSLKFLGKDIFSSPKEFTHGGNGFLKLNVLEKLPI